MKIQLTHKFDDIISINNLLEAWKEFEKGKRHRKDVQEFSLDLMDNIFSLHSSLVNHTYKHGGYQAFKINDPKPRDIHKAEVRDRLLHHAIYRMLYPFCDKTFIADSYSCRLNKGAHKAVNRLDHFTRKVSKNNTGACWILKCDIKKFFASIDHKILIKILTEYIPDQNILRLLEEIIYSFNTKSGAGLPLGNLTSQLFVNIYMNKFDQFMKHKIKAEKYIRYADDFVIIDSSAKRLRELVVPITEFLKTELKLELHPRKVEIRKFRQGIDFLGYVVLPYHKVLRTKTKKRMFRKIKARVNEYHNGIITEKRLEQSLQSYFGVLSHANAYTLSEELKNQYWFWLNE
ncbi:reverse transcriptase/maturase family protein [Patescibacteria group bacterium]|nr:reverse transcriptase/maturase family protein [Patescibacteria group bacterium]MBU4600924.1 reverse transcriptase/maturase family protein [Patescibacteria group bacterium]MCG2697622.1 reverse transcriptase/maturase family protein [Candidatus Parcubacteria bacterium]